MEAGADNEAYSSDEDEPPAEPSSETLLHRAARSGSVELVRMLLEHGADAAAKDSSHQTPLHAAALAETHGDVLQLLVQAPTVKIDAQDEAGDTALHCALRLQNRRHTIILLEAGARADIRNLAGRTALRHLVADFPQALETAFDHSLKLVRPLGWGARAVQFDYSLFDPCLLDDEEIPENRFIETRLMNSIDNLMTRDQLFLHPLCQSFLNLKWKVISPLYVSDIIIFALFVISFNVFLFAVVDKRKDENITRTASIAYNTNFSNITDTVPPDPGEGLNSDGIDFNVTYFNLPLETITFFLVAFTCLYIDLRETAKLWVIGARAYFSGPENIITWFCTSTAIACLCTDLLTFEQLRQIAAVCLLVSWTELLFMFGRAEFASTHVMLFVTLIRTLSVFMMVYTAITFAFTSSFYVLFCDKPDEFDGRFDTMTSAFFTTVVMSIGELNYDPTQLEGSKGGYFIYLLFIFFMLIITMNAMVGMAVNDTRDMAAKAEIKLHKKYLEFACIFERHMQWRAKGTLWRAVPSVGVTLLSVLPDGLLAASWHEMPEKPLGWRHRWRVMFAAWRGDVDKTLKSRDQLRRWLSEWPGLLRHAARIVLAKRHDAWDRPIEPGNDDYEETDGHKQGDKDDAKDGTKDGAIDGEKDADKDGATDATQRIRKDLGEAPGDDDYNFDFIKIDDSYLDEDEGDGAGAESAALVELRHAVLDLKCQLGKVQNELGKISRAVASIAYTQQTIGGH